MARFDQFIGRVQELNLMNRLWLDADSTMLILYGRRRIGKTRLLKQWVKQSQSRALYWVAEPSSASDQLRSFSQAVYNFANSQAPAPLDFSYTTWEQAWQQVALLAQQERFALLIDEFTYVLTVTPSIAGVLQNAWDHILKQTNLFLVISGSHLGMMQRHMLSYQAPLYGRATNQLHLQPMLFGYTQDFFPNYGPDERVAIYAIFGGVPAYWERINQAESISDNIRYQLLTPNNLMQAEPRLLLQDFVHEPHNYVSVLSAIAIGARTQKEISVRAGLAQGHISKYLSVLRDSGFVERRVPVTATQSSRLGRYHISDPYLRFYYRFLFVRQAQLAMDEPDLVLAEIRRHFLDFIGTHTWEELCREWTLRAGVRDCLPFTADQVGTAWTKKAQVNVVGINSMEKTIILGECKWQDKPIGRSILRQLVAKTDEIVPKQGQWQVCYLGFAREGWTDAAHQFAEAHKENGKNWHSVGVKLVGLDQVDSNLHDWVRKRP